jgi:hypothetical protein
MWQVSHGSHFGLFPSLHTLRLCTHDALVSSRQSSLQLDLSAALSRNLRHLEVGTLSDLLFRV